MRCNIYGNNMFCIFRKCSLINAILLIVLCVVAFSYLDGSLKNIDRLAGHQDGFTFPFDR